MRVVLGSKGIFPYYSSLLHLLFLSLFVMLRFAQNDTHNIMGYIFVTRDGECVIVVDGRGMCGLHFCNPQTVGRVVGGMGMGYIFVTRKQWVVGGGDVDSIFVTRDGVCETVVVGRWMCWLHFCNPRTNGWVVGGWGMGYIFVTRGYVWRCLEGRWGRWGRWV